MKIEEQVLSIEQMKHLKGLGLKVEDTAIVLDSMYDEPNLANTYFDEDLKECTPTLTLQEILELLPERIIVETKFPSFFKFHMTKKCMMYDNAFNLSVHHEEIKSSMLYSAYQMLCWILENGYFKK